MRHSRSLPSVPTADWTGLATPRNLIEVSARLRSSQEDLQRLEAAQRGNDSLHRSGCAFPALHARPGNNAVAGLDARSMLHSTQMQSVAPPIMALFKARSAVFYYDDLLQANFKERPECSGVSQLNVCAQQELRRLELTGAVQRKLPQQQRALAQRPELAGERQHLTAAVRVDHRRGPLL